MRKPFHNWGGKRAGAGRKSDRPRKIVSYRIATEVADEFFGTCFLLRVPPAAMLEEILEQWCNEREPDIQAPYEKWQANKAAFSRQPMSKANAFKWSRRGQLIGAAIEESAQRNAQRQQTIRALVDSACLFLTKKGRDPRTATPQEILEILGIGDTTSVSEIAAAHQSLMDSGDIERMIRENK